MEEFGDKKKILADGEQNEYFDLPEPPEIDQMKKDELYNLERDGQVTG